MNRIVLLLGSNIGAENNLRQCVAALCACCRILAISPVYETDAVGDAPRHRYFLNAVVILESHLGALQFKQDVIRKIETDLGRQREPLNDRENISMDIDILLFNREVLQLGKRQVPDPAITRDAHVAVPLADVAAEDTHPLTGERFDTIAEKFKGQPGIRLYPNLDLQEQICN
jgi:2-amino-4-hydroxy-6-hydroxymethyldihydropteridine diphosphokinase